MTLDEWLYDDNFTVLRLPCDEETRCRMLVAQQWVRDFASKQAVHRFSLSFIGGSITVVPLAKEEKALDQ